jgi:GTP cyclohydrolase I
METINNGSGELYDGYNKIESWDDTIVNEIAGMYYRILGHLGENPDREGLKLTPSRVAKALLFLTQGYRHNPEEILRGAMFRRITVRW